MPDLLDQLREQRAAARTAADDILTRAATEQRDLTPDELAEHGRQVAAEREAADAMDAERDRQLVELRAAATRRPGPAAPREPVLTREQSVYDWLQTRGAFDRYPDEPLSLQRYLRGMATGEWDGAEHERALAEATVGAGGALVPAPLSARVIDLMRARTVVLRAGGVTVPMTSQTLALARLTGEGTPAWKTEGANITAADLTFDRVTFTARTPGAPGRPERRAVRGRRPIVRGRHRPQLRRADGRRGRPGRPPRHRDRTRATRGAQPNRRDAHRSWRRRVGHHEL